MVKCFTSNCKTNFPEGSGWCITCHEERLLDQQRTDIITYGRAYAQGWEAEPGASAINEFLDSLERKEDDV